MPAPAISSVFARSAALASDLLSTLHAPLVARGEAMLNVCLAGPSITSNQTLIAVLRRHHEVSLVAHRIELSQSRAVASSDVLVLEASDTSGALTSLLRGLQASRPGLPIVLVAGTLTESDKADAFHLGVRDYFPAPCRVDLLIERLEALARAAS
jgi:DNA-binding response OmpR family regulator